MWTKSQCVSGLKIASIGLGGTVAIVASGLSVSAPATAELPPAPSFNASEVRYRVIVSSNNLSTLERVRQVTPKAFIQNFADGVDRIQAGAFVGQLSAQQRANALANAGIASIVFDTNGNAVYQRQGAVQQTPQFSPNGSTSSNTGVTPQQNTIQPVSKMPKGYYAVVPVARDQLGITFEAFRKLGIEEQFITFGQQRLGWHIAVGTYPNRSGAEKMSQYLRRRGGYDARAYYER